MDLRPTLFTKRTHIRSRLTAAFVCTLMDVGKTPDVGSLAKAFV